MTNEALMAFDDDVNDAPMMEKRMPDTATLPEAPSSTLPPGPSSLMVLEAPADGSRTECLRRRGRVS
jgi:hypothetical protein